MKTTPQKSQTGNGKAYSYIRFSTPEQSKGDSLRRQTAATTEYCKRNGLILDTSLSLQDLGVSAFRSSNLRDGALGGFIRAVDDGKILPGSTLIVESLDRLSRAEVVDALELFLSLIRKGVRLVTLTPQEMFERSNIDTTKLIIALTIMSRAHEESATKSERVGKAWAEKRKRAGTEILTARGPAWLKLNLETQRFEIIADKAETVRRIFRLCADGHGSAVIATRFNEERVPPIGRQPRWHCSYVKKILSNRSVLGEYQPHTGRAGARKTVGEPIPNYYPAIIDEAEFYEARQATAGRKNRAGRRGRTISNHSRFNTAFSICMGGRSPDASGAILGGSGDVGRR